ncbi:hypothetical protein [Gramella sp. AN32]|uniref:MSP domain-containing protein n=1 Tax=Christiangramia antarctica TaxID=2058158 RepID=A0ABW5X3C3_9FLAO|nr:hypothetical protein [Gramella sp. AN32]MCM4154881.1 hypothetical protein [Gramella sp. AN32]
MKKDLEIPEVKDIHVAAVKVYNTSFEVDEWNAYIINSGSHDIEMVLIVSKGRKDGKETSTMRHKIEILPAGSFAKIEFLQEDVLKLNNEFHVSFFLNNKMFDKKFVFQANSVKQSKARKIPVIPEAGILAK